MCECGAPLLVHYDLAAVRARWTKQDLASAEQSMWRYAPVLPADRAGSGNAARGLDAAGRKPDLGRDLGASDLWIKDEGRNPTDSFKARGMSCAVTMAKKLGASKLAIPSAGNAASALAAYAAAAGLEAHIFMPRDVPQANFIECKSFGAHVTLVDGLISDCGRIVAERKEREGWFEVSTLKEPYRIEGKKTMGYEVAEQFAWQLPDAILYPCGGGVGLIGMWKAFAELEQLRLDRDATAQDDRRAGSRLRAHHARLRDKARRPANFSRKRTHGCERPARAQSAGRFPGLQAVRESARHCHFRHRPGNARRRRCCSLGAKEYSPAPEGGACVAAVTADCYKADFSKPDERIVIYNTGSGLKYLEAYSTRFARQIASEQDKLGGLITPR